ncbi:MAG: hypothetical protein HGA65_15585 [Oscillochloris sp.]|nr:hypothetical protein [Oscillochloris sp.]
MRELEISVASYTLRLRFDNNDAPSGTVVRQPDGVEARFNTTDCLLNLMEGMVGQRAWQTHREQIISALREVICICA